MTLSTLKAILFDLDGTLLPLDNDRFVEIYLSNLARHSAAWGYDPATIVKTIWKSTGAMVKNDGSQTNEQAFWADKVILATNPIFPDSAVESRLSWIGLNTSDFDDITTYTNCSFSKPNPKYFASILEKHGLQPEECLMVGNNVGEDILPAAAVGIPTLLITDCLINEQSHPLDGIRTCTFAELESIINNL